MADKYSSPFGVLELGNKAWKVQVCERVEILSRDRLKPHLGSVAPKAAVPPKRGRPRMALVALVDSPPSAEKPVGPVSFIVINPCVCLYSNQRSVIVDIYISFLAFRFKAVKILVLILEFFFMQKVIVDKLFHLD